MNKTFIVVVIAILAVGSLSFYAGMKYSQSKSLAGGGFANLTSEQMAARFQQIGGADVGGQRGVRTGSGLAVGEIISKDADSITVKLNDGGSKIVFFSASTQVMRFSAGSPADLVLGENITINGAANQDGSVTAQTIQIRPEAAKPSSLPAAE